MRTQENNKVYTQEKLKAILAKCRKQIKSPETRQEAIHILDQLDSSTMDPENKTEFLYVNGRYNYYLHKDNGDIEALEWSLDYLQDMASYAYEHKISLELKMIYTRAYVLYLLGNLIWDEERKPWVYAKAKKIAQRMATKYPSNSSFNWLNSQLEI